MSFPRYPRYRPSGVEWPSEVPAHWSGAKKLGAISSLKGRLGWQGLKAEEYRDEGPYVVSSAHFDEQKIQWDECPRVSQERYDADANIQLSEGDVLLMKDGAAMGKLAFVDSLPGQACLNSHLLLFRPLATDDSATYFPKFAFYFMQTPLFQEHIKVNGTGATFLGISQEAISRYEVVWPPLAEQIRVAGFLDQETATIDELVAEQRRLMKLLKEKRQAVISRAVTRGLNPHVPLKPCGLSWLGLIPAHWEIKRIKHVVVPDGIQIGPFGGMLLALSAEDTGFKVFGQENTISGDFTLGQRWLEESRFRNLAAYHVTPGDLLLTRKGSLGNARLVHDLPQLGIIDSDTIRVRVDRSKIDDRLLALLMHEAAYIEQQVNRTKRGAILAGVNSETIANLIIAIPPLAEQTAIMRHLNEEMAKFDALTAETQRATGLLGERRAALISAAITGQIDVRQQS